MQDGPRKHGTEELPVKYMTFRASCSYAGLANMLECHGFDTEDRRIALDMGLPWLFSCEDGVYCAGPMLQSADWFNLYLKPRGFCLEERSIAREDVCSYLRSVSGVMLGLCVTPQSRHAVVYTGMLDGKYRFLNNKRQDSPEPEILLLTETELLARLRDNVIIAILSEIPPQPSDLSFRFQESLRTLRHLKKDLVTFCQKRQAPQELAQGRDRLFRAVLLDAVTMLELIQEDGLKENLLLLQRQFLDALKEGRPLLLQNRLSMPLLIDTLEAYEALIQERILSC